MTQRKQYEVIGFDEAKDAHQCQDLEGNVFDMDILSDLNYDEPIKGVSGDALIGNDIRATPLKNIYGEDDILIGYNVVII